MHLILTMACVEPQYAPEPTPHRVDDERPHQDSAEPLDTGSTTHPTSRAMVRIPAGTTQLGCTPGQDDCDEREGVYTVVLQQDFLIASHEFTRGEWIELTGEDPMPGPACDDCPVGNVSWHQVAVALNLKSVRDGLEPCYFCEELDNGPHCWANLDPFNNDLNPFTCEGYRLPTEAEWEVAARCGEDLVYAGSDVLDEVAWVEENSDGSPRPVGELAPNACGLYDMSGNVFEWNHDWYVEELAGETLVDPQGPAMGMERNARGGAWSWPARVARVSYRDRCRRPDMAEEDLGFRVARTVLEP